MVDVSRTPKTGESEHIFSDMVRTTEPRLCLRAETYEAKSAAHLQSRPGKALTRAMNRAAVTDARKRRNDLTDALRTVRKSIRASERCDGNGAGSSTGAIEVTDKICTPRFRDTAIVIHQRVADTGVTARSFLEDVLGRKLGVPVNVDKFMDVVRKKAPQ